MYRWAVQGVTPPEPIFEARVLHDEVMHGSNNTFVSGMNSRRNDCNAAMFWHCQSFGRGVFELRKIENGKIDPGGVISRVKFARWPQLLLEVLSQSYLAACLMAKAARSLACAPPPVLRAARVCPTGKVARCSRVVFSCASSSRPPLACCCVLGSCQQRLRCIACIYFPM